MMNAVPCEILDWDSAFFGFRIAKVRGDLLNQEKAIQIDRWCSQFGIRCLYFLSRLDDATTTRAAEHNGFRLVDIRMTFARVGLPVGSSNQLKYSPANFRHDSSKAFFRLSDKRKSVVDTTNV